MPRIFLDAPIDFYVAPDGNPNNPGTETQPFESPGTALRKLQKGYDLGNLDVAAMIHVDGISTTPYPFDGTIRGPFVGASGPAAVQVIGNTSDPKQTKIKPTSGYCFSAQYGAGFLLDGFTLDQSANTSNPFGPGQDLMNVSFGGTLLLNRIIWGDNGAGPGGGAIAPFNDITIIQGTVIVQGQPTPAPGTSWTAWCAFDKVAGHKYQAHVLCDNGYFLHNNNNCVDPAPHNYCTAYYGTVQASSAPPNFQDGVICINDGIVNWGTMCYPQSSYWQGNQASIRDGGIVFTAGYANGSQVNLRLPGTYNTVQTSKGGQIE
jgi:hypothetical protein